MNTPESPEIAHPQQRLSDMEARYQRYQEMFPGAINRIDELDKEREALRADVKRLRDGLEKLIMAAQSLTRNPDSWEDLTDALYAAQALLSGAAPGFMSLDDRSKREIIERCRLVESQNGLLTQRLDLVAKELDSLRYLVVQMMHDFDYLERTYKESLWTTKAGYTLQPRVLELREYLKRTDPDSPTGTADDAIPAATVEAIREHLATSEDSSEVRPHGFVYTLGSGVNTFCGECDERADHPIHARTERPIQAGDTVRHRTEGWTGTVETSDGYVVGVNCKRGLYGVSQLERVEPEKGESAER